MKKINLFAMGLLAAATSFTACSSSDELTGSNSSESKADGFYMTLSIQTPSSKGSRTAQPTGEGKTQDATAAESNVTTGTFYLVDESGKTVFTKYMTSTDWNNSKIPTQETNGKASVTIPVQKVSAGTAYTVYFLANATDAEPWNSKTYTVDNTVEGASKFAGIYDKSNAFVMFNENDSKRKADQYKVTFAENNKNAENPAKVMVGTGDNKQESPIYIERVTARIDEPTSKATQINTQKPSNYSNLSKAEQTKIDNACDVVSSVSMTRYAISNLSNSTYIMQNWTTDQTPALSIPSSLKDFSYIQPTSEFGDATKAENLNYFTNTTTTENTKHVDYVFENNSETAPTTMYFEYKINLNAEKFSDKPDCTDGTFYRYDNKIYRSIHAIYEAYKSSTSIFNGKTEEEVKKELKLETETEKTTIGASEDDLAKFRSDYTIEVFRGGLAYYKTTIKDSNYNKEQIFRNTIYQLTVNNVYNIGADVPNGNPDDVKAMYYLDIEVAVLNWVSSTQEVNLK